LRHAWILFFNMISSYIAAKLRFRSGQNTRPAIRKIKCLQFYYMHTLYLFFSIRELAHLNADIKSDINVINFTLPSSSFVIAGQSSLCTYNFFCLSGETKEPIVWFSIILHKAYLQ
jgi:hypothetical protein